MKIRILKNGKYLYFYLPVLTSSGSFWGSGEIIHRLIFDEKREIETDNYVHDDFAEVDEFDKIEIFLNNKWLEV